MAKKKDEDFEDPVQKELVKAFNAAFPDSPMETLEDSSLAEVPGWIDTGNYALNWVSSKSIFNGFPLGRIVLLSGDAGTGKSLIALSLMKQPDIDYIIYLDSEGGGISRQFAKFLGINTKKVYYQPIDTIEGLIERFKITVDTLEKNKQTGKKVLVVVDSISMLSTERELDPNAGSDMGNKAKKTREFFRTYSRKMQSLNMCAVFTAHLIQNIGGYGPAQMVTGGSILQYAPSLEVRLAKVNAESEIEKSAKGASMIKLRAEIIKSRFGTLAKRVTFDLDMQNGLDRHAGLIDIMRDYGFIIPGASDLEKQIAGKEIPKKSTGWWVFKPWVDEDVGDKALKIHERLIAEKVTNTGKFREDAIKEYCKNLDWFLPAVQDVLSSIYEEELKSETEKIEDVMEALSDEKHRINIAVEEEIQETKSDMSEVDVAALFESNETPIETKKKKGSAIEISEA